MDEAQMFQSLFSWNSPSDTGIGGHEASGIYVSILVFVELALGPPTITGNDYLSEFQSLFSWNSPSDDISEYENDSLS